MYSMKLKMPAPSLILLDGFTGSALENTMPYNVRHHAEQQVSSLSFSSNSKHAEELRCHGQPCRLYHDETLNDKDRMAQIRNSSGLDSLSSDLCSWLMKAGYLLVHRRYNFEPSSDVLKKF